MVNHFNKSKSQKKIVVAMDSFKGSLTSMEAGNAVRDGILEQYPNVDVQIFPVADGGEGTVEALTFGKEHVQTRTISVTGPVGTEVLAGYTIYEQAGEKTAVLEMAQAAGLPFIPGMLFENTDRVLSLPHRPKVQPFGLRNTFHESPHQNTSPDGR